MLEFEQNLAPGTKEELYIGTAFIVLKTQRDLQTIVNFYDSSLLLRFFNYLKGLLCGCCIDKE